MNCDFVKTQFVDLMYEELDEAKTQDMHTHLDACESCKKELAALMSTKQLLRAIPQEEPQERIVFAAPPRRSVAAWWRDLQAVLPQKAWARLSLGLATAALFVLVLGSLSNFTLQYDEQGLTVSMGLLPQQQTEIAPEVMEAYLAQVRQENVQYTARLIAEAQEKQNQQWNENFTRFALEMDRKRDTELYMISNQMERMNESTNQQFRELIRSVNFQR